MRGLFSSDVDNSVGVRNVYPNAQGASVGVRASAATPYAADANPAAGEMPAAAAASGGKPLLWWVGLVALLIALMFLGRKVGGESGNFANIKVTAWNTLLVTLMAIIGINAAKAGTAYVNVPGLTPLIHAT